MALEQALDLAERVDARLLLAVSAPLDREDTIGDLPGMEPDPVERAVSDASLWRVAPDISAELPEHAASAAVVCEREQVPCRVFVVHGNVLLRLRALSRLADLLVSCCPGPMKGLSLRDGVRLAMTASCPCLFTATEPVAVRKLSALYDGTPEGARSLRYAAALCDALNLRIAVTAIGPSRHLLHQRMEEAHVIVVGYHLEHSVDGLLGLRPSEFPIIAQDEAADIVAGPRSRGLLLAALRTPSLLSLTGY